MRAQSEGQGSCTTCQVPRLPYCQNINCGRNTGAGEEDACGCINKHFIFYVQAILVEGGGELAFGLLQ